MTAWDEREADRACAALAFLAGDIDMREAKRRLIATGLDPDEAHAYLDEAATDRIG